MKRNRVPFMLAAALLLAACASVPSGPSVLALPGTGRTFEQFRFDDVQCRDFAHAQVGGSAQQAASNAQMRSAAAGTAVGALAGAAIGGQQGAGVGAGTGLLIGSVAGTEAGYGSAYGSQRRYDNAYVQCMYAKGNKVPVSANFVQPQQLPAPPSGAYPPPPPPPPARQ